MIDFALLSETNKRLEHLISGELDESEIERVLRERTKRIGARFKSDKVGEVLVEVIVARRGDSLFGFPIDNVVEVRRVTVTPLPQTGNVICGLFDVRGHTHCMIDLLALMGRVEPMAEDDETTFAVRVSGASGELGIRVDEIIGSRVVYEHEWVNRSAHQDNFISSVTGDLLSIVYIDALLDRPELLIESAK